MKIQLPLNFTIALLLFSSFILFISAWRMTNSSHPKKHKNLPPSPPKLPVIGHLHHLIGGLPHRSLSRLAQKFGGVLYLQLGQVPVVVVSSREAAKQILRIHDPACADRPQTANNKIMFYDCNDIIFGQYSEHWKQMRKICTMELLGSKNVRSFGYIRQDEGSNLVKSLQSSLGKVVNLTAKILAMTSSVVCRAALGKVSRESDMAMAMIKQVLSYGGMFELADLFPSSKLLHVLLGWKRYKLLSMRRKLDKILDVIIEEHKLKKSGEFGGEDVVDVLLRMNQDGKLEFPITNENIKAVIFDVLAGGIDTTAAAIDWVMAELIRNPRVMAKVQSEVRRAFRENKPMEESDVTQSLRYLKLVIKESLRLHPPGSIVPRFCRDECKVDGYSIPRKSWVSINVWSIGRDPEYWDEPESFRPERFDNDSLNFLGNNFEYIPFGSGKRICPGMHFALASMELTLAQLLYHFNWETPQGVAPADVDMTETNGATVTRQNGLFLIASAYNPPFED
uniref:Cytochrome P450 71D615 n=1 Tax=Leucophyllum frutescens TaxID=86643 RepID=A0A7G6J4K9_LEUFR|nr:cytochrome P450 71D615 [Leucophyllum frutescens]